MIGNETDELWVDREKAQHVIDQIDSLGEGERFQVTGKGLRELLTALLALDEARYQRDC
jgi:hypothetical protein